MLRHSCLLLKLQDPNGSLQQTGQYSGKFRFMNIVAGYSRGRRLSLTLSSAHSIESAGHEMLIPQDLGQREITISWNNLNKPLKIRFQNRFSLSLEVIQKKWNPFNSRFGLISAVILAHIACVFALKFQIHARRPLAIASSPKIIEAVGLQHTYFKQAKGPRESIGRISPSAASLNENESAILKKWKFQTHRQIVKQSEDRIRSQTTLSGEGQSVVTSQLSERLSTKKRLIQACMADLKNHHPNEKYLSASFLISRKGTIQNILFDGVSSSDYTDFASCLRNTLGQITTLELAQDVTITQTLIFD